MTKEIKLEKVHVGPGPGKRELKGVWGIRDGYLRLLTEKEIEEIKTRNDR